MSLVMNILEGLWDTEVNYKGTKVNLLGVVRPQPNSQNQNLHSFNSTFYRLRKNGFVEIRSGQWVLTPEGKKYFSNKKKLSARFNSPFKKNDPKNFLLMFDIPESHKKERDWLRGHLKIFDYLMIQKSVWVGPSPLPKKFTHYLKELGLNKFIKTFKLAKPFKFDK